MSINRISPADAGNNFQKKVIGATLIGAVGGGAYSATNKNWLYKDMPSDSFVKSVSQNLRNEMTSEELKESFKINKFLADTVNPEFDIEALKPQIRDSRELSEAIKIRPEEGVEEAIMRVFSQPKDKVKLDLINLQLKTTADKKNRVNSALKLVNNNYDAAKKSLVKDASTSEKTFGMIKSAAKLVQIKSVATITGLTALGAGALALVLSKVPDKNS